MAGAEVKSHNYPKGYPPSMFAEAMHEKYLCGYCNQVLRNPMQNNCGHRFCQECVTEIQHLLTTGETVSCRLCLEEGMSDMEAAFQPEQTFPDRAVFRELSRKKVCCPNPGCPFKSVLQDYMKHEESCKYKIVDCPHECGMKIAQSHLSKHETTECSKNRIQCEHCGMSLLPMDLSSHLKESCEKRLVKCQFCKEDVPSDKMSNHLSGECSVSQGCPVGCQSVVKKDELESHLSNNLTTHFSELMKRMVKLENNKLSSDDFSITPQLGLLVGNLREQVMHHEQVIDQLGSANGELFRRLPCIQEQMKTLENVVVTLKAQIAAYEEFSQEILNRYLQSSKEKEELVQKMSSLARTLALKDVALAEQELRIKALENTSYDGTLLWKITDFTKKMQDARNGRIISFYSPCFHTSRNGYKMCARIYPGGDGMGKGSHISLFFVLMRGQFDAMLPWPYKQKVTFMLLDQSHREHILDAFNPDQNSPSFQRPVSEMNIASGCPLFVPLNHITQCTDKEYIKDDTIFIKIIVDCSDLTVL